MKKVIIKGSRHLLLPAWLAKLVILYGKTMDDMLEYDPDKVDGDWSKTKRLFYISSDGIKIDNSIDTVYGNEEKAKEVRTETENKKIGEIMRIKGYKIKDFESNKEELEKNVKLLEQKDIELADKDIEIDNLKRTNQGLECEKLNLGVKLDKMKGEYEDLYKKAIKKK